MKKYIRLLGPIILSIIIFRVDFDLLVKTIFSVDTSYLIFTVILFIPLTMIKSYRWKKILKMQNIQYPFSKSFLAYFSSLYIGFITPGRLGEFAKILYLKSDLQVPLSKGFSSVLFDRILDFYLLIILGLIGIQRFSIGGTLSIFAPFLLMIILLFPLIFINKSKVSKFSQLIYDLVFLKKIKIKFKENFEEFHNGINDLINIRIFNLIFLTFISYLIFFSQCFLLTKSMNLQIDFFTIVLFMSISNLFSFIPISISGLGTRDAALIYLFSLIGLQSELAVGYAFLIFFSFFFCGGIMGSIAWFIKPIKI